MIRLVLLGCILLMASQARAFFDFGTVTAPNFVWDHSVPNPVYTFTVDFRAYCNSSCVGQDYRLALSDENPGSDSPITPGTEPDSYQAAELSEFLVSASYSQGSDSGILVPGQWSHGADDASFFATTVNTSVTGTYSFTFNSQRLQQLSAGTYNLDFFIAGEDMSNTRHLNSTAVRIPIVVPELVKISGLEDISLKASDLGGGNVLDGNQEVCVFSNTGNVKLDFDGSSAPGANFQLSKAGSCSQAGDCVNYRMRVRTPSENWLMFRRKGQRENNNNNNWTASDSLDCGGAENMTLSVRLRRNDIQGAEAGVFQDTMTVIVSPL